MLTGATFERRRFATARFGGNLFLLGKTRSGKTTLAAELMERDQRFGGVLSASEWIKRDQPERDEHERHMDYVARITTATERRLRHDPNACVRYMLDTQRLRGNRPGGKGWIVDGIRSPYDFVHLFRPHFDFALFLDNRKHALDGPFDDGLSAILGYVHWLARHLTFENYDWARIA